MASPADGGAMDDQGYDEVPYPDLSHSATHPGRLAALATLLGLQPPPVETWRVLELGCAGGANLVPMAYGLPDATFVGVDLGAVHIANAHAAVEATGVTNVTFHRADLRDLHDLGGFDLVIAHGLYSWVPEDVRDRILTLCSEVLAPHGLAFVSFNTLPGWHHKLMVREMMRYRVRAIDDPAERVAAARALMSLVAAEASTEGPLRMSVLGAYVAQETLARMDDDGLLDSVLLHDELGEINDPVYFHEFNDHAQRSGLRYLVEADLRDSLLHDLAPESQAGINLLSTTMEEVEQYADFVRNRTFRRAVLCRADVDTDRTLRTGRILDLAVTSGAHETEPQNDGKVSFRSPDGAMFSSDHDLTIAALRLLEAGQPGAVRFRDLALRAAAALAEPASDEDNAQLASALVTCHGHSRPLVDLRADRPAPALVAGERPFASPPARHWARRAKAVTNLLHDRFELEDRHRHLLLLLDGTRDRAALVEAGADPEHLDVDLAALARVALLVR